MNKFMSTTPYFDAYEKYRKNKLNFNFGIKKIFTTINGETVLKDIEFIAGDGTKVETFDSYLL